MFHVSQLKLSLDTCAIAVLGKTKREIKTYSESLHTANTVWNSTGGRVTKSLFRYTIGGEY